MRSLMAKTKVMTSGECGIINGSVSGKTLYEDSWEEFSLKPSLCGFIITGTMATLEESVTP